MSRTVRTTGNLCRAGAAAAAAALLLTACGGSDDGGSASGSTDTPAAAGADASETPAASGAADFCAQAEGIDQRVEDALAGLDDDDPSVADAFRQISVELRDIEAPAAISEDWTALSAGLDRMADAFADLDITDLDSLDSLDQAEGDLTTASDHVDQYLSDECGL
jgi:hypothetical protein